MGGQSAGLAHDLPTVQEILNRTVQEAAEILSELSHGPASGAGPGPGRP
eukprot:NODE_12889_length_221_cov_35.941860_g11119_i0.p3 GENE.NODE_12889_length_221_cov_35.941860_g11119_i0~~NODE_12889_length_221_cov_35.941860_g11119_i0.p3  ORF type:complete len:57 (+),score=20.21 NODE_12889_length_221_cov_35.941860_g11119_i0:26-172(+)